METYFEISRPAGVPVRFEDILKRTNSSFVLTLRLPSSLNSSPVQVSIYRRLYVKDEARVYALSVAR